MPSKHSKATAKRMELKKANHGRRIKGTEAADLAGEDLAIERL